MVFLVFGSGPSPGHSAIPGSPALWNAAGGGVLKIAVFSALASVLIVLVGLRRLTAPAESPAAAITAIAAE